MRIFSVVARFSPRFVISSSLEVQASAKFDRAAGPRILEQAEIGLRQCAARIAEVLVVEHILEVRIELHGRTIVIIIAGAAIATAATTATTGEATTTTAIATAAAIATATAIVTATVEITTAAEVPTVAVESSSAGAFALFQ